MTIIHLLQRAAFEGVLIIWAEWDKNWIVDYVLYNKSMQQKKITISKVDNLLRGVKRNAVKTQRRTCARPTCPYRGRRP